MVSESSTNVMHLKISNVPFLKCQIYTTKYITTITFQIRGSYSKGYPIQICNISDGTNTK